MTCIQCNIRYIYRLVMARGILDAFDGFYATFFGVDGSNTVLWSTVKMMLGVAFRY